MREVSKHAASRHRITLQAGISVWQEFTCLHFFVAFTSSLFNYLLASSSLLPIPFPVFLVNTNIQKKNERQQRHNTSKYKLGRIDSAV